MEFFLPSLLLMIFAAAVAMILPRFTPLLLATIALVCLVLAIYNHYSLFMHEYSIMTWTNTVTQFAPYFMVGGVVVLMVGYLLYLFGLGRMVTLSMPSNSIPPPSTATNYVTEAIGNGLAAAGTPVQKPANARENQRQNIANSVLSKGI